MRKRTRPPQKTAEKQAKGRGHPANHRKTPPITPDRDRYAHRNRPKTPPEEGSVNMPG